MSVATVRFVCFDYREGGVGVVLEGESKDGSYAIYAGPRSRAHFRQWLFDAREKPGEAAIMFKGCGEREYLRLLTTPESREAWRRALMALVTQEEHAE